MSHQNIFNSAADRETAEKKFRRISNAFVIAGVIGIGSIVTGKVIGGDQQIPQDIGGIGLATFILSAPYRRRMEDKFTAAKKDVYTPS